MADLFKDKSKDWDANERVTLLSQAVGSSIVEHVPLNDTMTVMDFGAGTGLISSHVAPWVKKIIAVDVSESMLNNLAAKPELKEKVRIACQDIRTTPINEKFDLIMSAMALHHVDDTPGLIGTFSQHLKPGALIALADLDSESGSFHPPGTEGVFHCGFDRKELQAILEHAGFTDVHFRTAYTVHREENNFTVFLVTARKKQ
jgi:cyclopropane fatty-acyl-phospholipid synthase-like methyltransferase